MKKEGYTNVFKEEETNLLGIGISPSFAIGQRALLIESDEGNILWDCVPYIDEDTIQKIEALGGIKAIAISHPHFYSSMIAWAERFDCPIYLHEADQKWVMRPSERVHYWSGEYFKLAEDVTVVRLGGHFAGSSVLHWKKGANGKGALLTSDTIYVVADREWVSFMYSYPNLIPLPSSEVKRMVEIVEQYEFDRLYSAWFNRIVEKNAQGIVQKSAKRYIEALETPPIERSV